MGRDSIFQCTSNIGGDAGSSYLPQNNSSGVKKAWLSLLSKPQKSLLSHQDKLKSLNFARKSLKLSFHFWIVTITCYLDNSRFAEARAVPSMARRLQGRFSITASLQRDERTGVMSNAQMTNFFVAIVCRNDLVMCKLATN